MYAVDVDVDAVDAGAGAGLHADGMVSTGVGMFEPPAIAPPAKSC